MEAVEEPPWLTAEEQQTWLPASRWSPPCRRGRRPAAARRRDQSLRVPGDGDAVDVPQRTRRRSEAAALANGSLTRLSRTVDRLDGRGWVIRRPDPEDGRSTLAVLTDAGWDEVASTAPAHVAEVRRLVFDPLTKTQVRQLHEMAERIRQVARPAGWLPILPLPDSP